jgi:uncharacterized protein YqeY
MLLETIRQRLKEAMKARREVEREILRVALGEIQTEEARGTAIGDAEVERIVRKLIKSDNETLEATSDPARQATLREEIAVLESLLPQRLGVDAIVAALRDIEGDIRAAKAEGQAIGVAMKHLKPKGLSVDGKDVAVAVKQLRS